MGHFIIEKFLEKTQKYLSRHKYNNFRFMEKMLVIQVSIEGVRAKKISSCQTFSKCVPCFFERFYGK